MFYVIAEIKEAFHVFDTNNNGVIELHEVINVLRILGQNPTVSEVQQMIKELDSDGI